jgi:hypothetical protein
MPFRTKETLERWVADFEARGHDVAGTIGVLDHDDEAGGTGLVVVHLEHVPIDVYLEPLAPGDPHWTVTFTRRDVDVTMDAQRLAGLVAELTIASELCTYLEERSTEYVATGGR